MTEMVYGTVPRAPGEAILPRWWRTIDIWVMAAIVSLFVIGLLLALAASPALAERNGLGPYHYVSRQGAFGMLALFVMVVISTMEPQTVKRWAVFGFFVSFVAVALLPLLGTDFGKGATRWYSLGFASLQPSEFLKPCFVVFSAWLMRASFDRTGPPGKLISFGFAVTLALMLALQPDFGQAALILSSWGMMYFVAGAPMLLLIGMAGVVFFAGQFAYSNSEHFARRIDGYLNPEVDPTTQLGYAVSAIREGGFLGVGVGEGRVKMVLPDAHTDFIIAVAAEEYGLVLVVLIIALFLLITLRSLWALMRERDPFIRLAGTGLAALFGMQALINLGVAVRLLPAKGMTLPLVSYGGSSLLAMGIALGMLLAMTRRRPQDELSDVLGDGR